MLHKGKIKYLTAVIAALSLAISPFTVQNVEAAGSNVIYQKTDKQIITQGVTLENDVKFTTDGWYNINKLTVDLSNKYINVDTLTNNESIGKLTGVKKLAQQANAVAAVNASFFIYDGGSLGHPVGTIVKSSDVLCASNDINKYSDSMASLSLTKLNEVMLNYWKSDMNLVSSSGVKLPVAQYNKLNGSKFTDLTVIDRKWGTTSRGATTDMPDVFQMVVENGIVTKFLNAQPGTAIPENGFVVVTRTEGAKKLQSTFAIGDSITFDIASTPDWSNIKMSVSGCSILVDKGNIPSKFSYAPSDVAAASPKTAIGSSKDGKLLYMVTIDGRQTASVGMSLKDLASYMKSIGAYNAICMDGGGSTTMVARTVGNSDVSIVNLPSDGSARSVSTGIGVFTSAPKGELASLLIETTDRYIFTNTTRAFTVKGYDNYNNPIDVDLSSVKWSVSGVKGQFNGNVFKPTTYGEGKITAKIGSVSGSIDISVLSEPAKLTLSTKSVKMTAGQTHTFKITGENLRGYKAEINPVDIKWTVSNKLGTFNNGVFTASKNGAGYIEAAFANAKAYCALSVAETKVHVADNFEKLDSSFVSYPTTIKGSYALSDEVAVSGSSSGKLTYDFPESDSSRAAYMVYPGEGIKLDVGTVKMGLEVYNDHENTGWLRAEITDANGEKKVVDLAKAMDWTGWKHTEASLSAIKMPARLNRIYIVQTNPVADSGNIYFDDLTLTNSIYPSTDGIKIPEDTVPVDEANKAVNLTKGTKTAFRFAVLGQSKAPQTDLEKKLAEKFATKLTKYLEVGAIVGNASHESITSKVKNTVMLATHNVDLPGTKAVDYKYSMADYQTSRFIKLDTRKNSLRTSDPDQWKQFLNDLDSFTGKNVFIFMAKSPDTFTDKLEMELFKKTISDYRLKTLRNVWVFYNGDTNESHMEKGVKYISTAGYGISGLSAKNSKEAQYVLVTVQGGTVNYVFKPIES
jgi:exopolysaccharide biosynthesis protein